eukprot:gene3350-3572_t
MSHNPLYSNPNGFPLANGTTLHMDLKAGDLANRVITVGSPQRAKLISEFFDKDQTTRHFTSSRGFVTYTGFYKGVPVSVVAIGMGISMMDFFVRESRAIVEGPMAMIRYGTCGGISPEANQGKIALASQGSGFIMRNPDAFDQYYHGSPTDSRVSNDAYHFYNIAPADESLTNLLRKNITDDLGADVLVEGVNVTADSFYSSQGRIDDRFHDDNVGLINKIHAKYPNSKTLEMETFFLFHLAKVCTKKIKASAATIIVANRLDSAVIEDDVLQHLEQAGGHAVLKAIAEVSLD